MSFFSSNFSYNSNLYIRLSFHFTCDINEEIIGFEVYLSIISNDVITDVVFCCFTHILQMVTGMNEILEIIVTETNRYATQKGCNFKTTEDKMKVFLRINFIMGINKLPSLEDYWSTDKCIRNEKIQNVMTRARFWSILQNLHFSNNDNDDKTDKSYKICHVIKHLNKVFAESLSNSPSQSVDKHMCKFKGRLSIKQYINNNPMIKWCFKY